MDRADGTLFDAEVWGPALEKYGAVTHLTVALYGVDGERVRAPAPATPLFAAFERQGYDPGLFVDCARRCLAQAEERPAVVCAPAYGLAVVGTSLVLEGTIAGAAVAGYGLMDFAQAATIERLARQAGIPFRSLWEVARQQQPLPERRLILHGELLQVLGDTILRENHRSRQYEDVATRLTREMAAKDEFLAILSHELRTPLTPILTWVHLLRQEGNSATDVRRAVDAIERSARLQLKLVDDLLDMNRVIREKVPLDVAVHDVSDLLASAVENVAAVAMAKRIALDSAAAVGSLTVEGDAGRLQQVFVNVLSNAVKFTPAGGRIGVTADKEGDTAVVRIADTGEGIPPEFLPHAFEMFRQQEEGTRRRHSGLGIGLALVKRLVELHGGSAEIASGGPGRGTEVTIRLPLASRAVGASSLETTPKPDAARPFGDLTILVVEDTEDAREALGALLLALGAQVLTARDGLEALEVVSKNRTDLVLCDLRMPRMDGFEFLTELCRAQGHDHPPVVAVTGLVTESDQRRTQAAGFQGHLKKPFDGPALISAVRATLSHRRTA